MMTCSKNGSFMSDDYKGTELEYYSTLTREALCSSPKQTHLNQQSSPTHLQNQPLIDPNKKLYMYIMRALYSLSTPQSNSPALDLSNNHLGSHGGIQKHVFRLKRRHHFLQSDHIEISLVALVHKHLVRVFVSDCS